MGTASLSAIRAFVSGVYIEPARRAGEPTIDVRLGHVQRCMNLTAHVAVICSALESLLFSRRYGVKALKRTGPVDGEYTLMTFKLLPRGGTGQGSGDGRGRALQKTPRR